MAYELHIKLENLRACGAANPHINGGNPEHVCPETGVEAWCYHKACELNTCEEAKRQQRRAKEREAKEWTIARKQACRSST